MIEEIYKAKKEAIINLCQQAEYVSYTCDLWKSAAKEYYVAIALHFYDDHWKLHHPLIAIAHIEGSHKKDLIGKFVAEKILPFLGQSTKVINHQLKKTMITITFGAYIICSSLRFTLVSQMGEN
jgi:hypothetical protein